MPTAGTTNDKMLLYTIIKNRKLSKTFFCGSPIAIYLTKEELFREGIEYYFYSLKQIFLDHDVL